MCSLCNDNDGNSVGTQHSAYCQGAAYLVTWKTTSVLAIKIVALLAIALEMFAGSLFHSFMVVL